MPTKGRQADALVTTTLDCNGMVDGRRLVSTRVVSVQPEGCDARIFQDSGGAVQAPRGQCYLLLS